MYQEKLLNFIQKKLSPKASMIEVIAATLDISYDAAHRRVSLKSKFSLEELGLLAKAFDISLDQLFQTDSHVLVKKTKEINSYDGLASYIEQSMAALKPFAGVTGAKLYYSAKDIPLFYIMGADLLSRFKLYVWINLLGFEQGDQRFEDYKLKFPIHERTSAMKDFYNSVQKHEIWNETTINSTLQQIIYFFRAGLLSMDTGHELCDHLMALIQNLEKQCVPENDDFQLYYHELLILNNNVLLSSPQQKSLFVPYTMLGYFITQDQDTCHHAHGFFQQQLKNSMLLNKVGTRDKKMFFNRMYQKIEYYKGQIRID